MCSEKWNRLHGFNQRCKPNKQRFSNSGGAPLKGRRFNAKGGTYSPLELVNCTNFIDNDPTYSDWGSVK